MIRLALRRHLFRWISIIVIRGLLGVRPQRYLPWAILGSWAILGAGIGSFAWWLVTGGGPWHKLGLDAGVAVTARGLPPGRFWLREPLRRYGDASPLD